MRKCHADILNSKQRRLCASVSMIRKFKGWVRTVEAREHCKVVDSKIHEQLQAHDYLTECSARNYSTATWQIPWP